MRFPADLLPLCALIIFAASGASAAAGAAGTAARPTPGAAVTPDEVRAAAAKLEADPNLGGEHKLRWLRWTQSGSPDQPRKPAPWVAGLFEYLGQTGSVLLWAAGAAALAIGGIWAYRTFRAHAPAPRPMNAPAVVRVGNMDIRPEALPEDIGAAAIGLAEAGKTREALSLLYRGALSRVVHRFGVPIGESYTEGEALRAVGARLDPARVSYFSHLVDTRRRAVYAGETTAGDSVGQLCRDFNDVLDLAAA